MHSTPTSLRPLRLPDGSDFSSPPETPSHLPPAPPCKPPDDIAQVEVSFRHSGWWRQRNLIRGALEAVGVPEKRLQRFDMCGSSAWVVQDKNDPDHYSIASDHCRDRFCQACATERSNRVARNLTEAIGKHPCRFITLTLKTTNEPLAESLKHLYDSFARLRRTKLWTSAVTAGAASCEIKWNEGTNRWHPHLHLLVVGSYLPQKLLSEAWRVASRGSFVVDVRLVRDSNSAARYVSKYATKPLNSSFVAVPDRLQEAVLALKGRRLILTFGLWATLQLLAGDSDVEWRPIAPLWRIIDEAAVGSPSAKAILRSLTESQPCKCNSP